MHLSSPTSASLSLIPGGKAGIIETLRLMRRLVREAKRDLRIRTLALSIVEGLPQKAWSAEAAALHEFVRDRIRYVRDIKGVETLQLPHKTVELGQGDCDDKSLLLAALLESLGHPTRFVAIGFSPDHFEHVYTESKIGADWMPLEATEDVEPGWMPQRVVSRLVIHN